ncbi:nuclear pore membrane glycoprotein 210-like isoform X3 [Canis lupus baileyi]|uniref:nuclear pore membrane glycoprotein 210-like isoform X3 n=1 Tax=Canis lupus familiaris TaxID=9615 RepID=UPI000BAA3338|nr:nuclear pore membrane glycoprotein 210-like isoform X3 [Canis lupus familiaris]XP_038399200.1 nuclear pore membrane glycoprotein 210-like isoform X3 [Canis lupus familiaris]|eukprot:XP_022277091.1 nuclear pore membrane glycoprotein 210-like isoform X3 [Canis lupus familiaris]
MTGSGTSRHRRVQPFVGWPAPGILLLLQSLLGTLASKLNVPQVLLPFGREPGRVPFLLEAQRGCYTWHSTHHDAVTVEPLYENGTLCSQKAVLIAESTQPIRLSSIILAREIVTDHELRCDVKVDVINSIEIVSRTRELYVDDSPLELMVRALDAEGNTFSSLAGMMFEWSVAQDNESAREELSSKIRILKYSEAEYSPPVYIAEMEKEEKQGDMILVSGIRTGAAVVKVRIYEPFYKKVAAALIRLLVLENIFLIPSHDIYLLVGAYIKYRVAKMVQGRMTEVGFPLEHYTLELQDPRAGCNGSLSGKVALLDEKTAMVTAVHLGQTNLVFVHKNVHMRSVSGLPNCTIYVVEPGFLGFTVQPGDRWSLEVGQVYVITVEVFDKSSTKVYISDNKNIQPVKFPIIHQQEVKIYFPIQLTPNFLAFPHHPMGMLYRYKVQVEGGSGNFTWTSSNETVAMVTTKGVVTAGQVRGNSTILARDVQNPFRYGEIKIYVLKLNKMELLPFHADVEIGQIIEVPIAMYHVNKETKEVIVFSDCSHLLLDLNMDKQGVFTLLKEGIQRPGPTHCSSTHIAAKSLGHTLVTVSVTESEEYLESSATFAAYEPLKAVNPVEVALVTWQSVKEMVFEGGPRPWILEPSRFFLELSMEKTEKIELTQVRLPAKRKQNQYIYRVLCLDLGEQTLTFRIGNNPGVLNPSPAVEAVQVRFMCAHPASMSVTPVYREPAGAQPCPLPQHNKQLIPVSSLRDTVLELAVFDQHRRKFDNFSSLILEWKSSNETLAHFENYNSVEMVAKDDGSGQTRLHGHQVLKVHQLKGTVLIGVNFVGYSEKKSPEELFNLLRSAAIELLLVDDVTVLPENATIYNHPDVKEIFSLVEGSGYFLVNSSEQDIVTITYMEAESSIQLVPVHSGFLTLEVYDLCLAFLGPAVAYLRVSDIQELELDLIDKVEIGKTVLVTLRVLGSSKRPFRNKYFRNMELKLQLASAIVTLTLVEEQDEYSENYILRAVSIGQTTLVAIARDKMGRKFTSAPRQVEVFPPFKLVPEKMTLIPANMMQVMSEGGPQPQSIIHFSISNQTVAVVNRRGQVTGKVVGTAVVHGTIQTVNEDTGKVIVFSQDEVYIEVVQLRAVRILAAATRLITATEMPVYVMGVTSTQTPFSFSNANPGLTFHWSMSKRDVLDLVPRHSEVFLQLPVENNFAMVVHTKAAGRTSIKVTVRCMNSSSGQLEGNLLELSDEVQILVFEKLQLFFPECQPEQILMPMNSQLRLHTNREGAAFVSSRVLKCFPNSSVIEEDGEGLLKAGSIAGTAVLEVTSVEPFGVNQTTITGVQVAPVTYLRMSSQPKLYAAHGRTLPAFPVGMSLTFIVQFYNSIGEKFHTHNTQLHLALNRDDLLLIGPGNRNYTYVAQAVNTGVTLLGIWDRRHPGVADYIPVAVEHAIEPDTHLTFVGDVICFSTHLLSHNGEPGIWMISADNILQTDTGTGVGVARSPGIAVVFHDIPGVVKTYREVVVNASSRLTLSFDLKTHLTNTPNSTVFKLFITTGRNGANLKGSCTPSQALAITTILLPETLVLCHVQFSNTLLDIPASKIFNVHAGFSMEKGVYVCLIKVRPQSEELLQALSVADTSVYGWATLVSERSRNGMQRILIPFIPAFYINQSEVVLSHRQDIGEIRVLGVDRVLEKLEVFPSSPVLVVSGHRESSLTPGLAVYRVRVVNFTSLQQTASPIFINISCALTSQSEAVLVRALKDKSGTDQCKGSSVLQKFLSSHQTILFTLFAMLASTAFIFLAYNAVLNKIQTVPIVYVPTLGTSQPGSYAPTTRSPPPFLSPQPPPAQSRLQHWLWSVRH